MSKYHEISALDFDIYVPADIIAICALSFDISSLQWKNCGFKKAFEVISRPHILPKNII